MMILRSRRPEAKASLVTPASGKSPILTIVTTDIRWRAPTKISGWSEGWWNCNRLGRRKMVGHREEGRAPILVLPCRPPGKPSRDQDPAKARVMRSQLAPILHRRAFQLTSTNSMRKSRGGMARISRASFQGGEIIVNLKVDVIPIAIIQTNH